MPRIRSDYTSYAKRWGLNLRSPVRYVKYKGMRDRAFDHTLNVVKCEPVSIVREELERCFKNGYCRFSNGSFYDVYGFLHQDCVIKIINVEKAPESHYHRCPGADSIIAPFFLYPTYKSSNEDIIVQPLADTSFRKQQSAFRTIIYKLRGKIGQDELIEDFWPDAHEGNVGIYKGEPKIIDFSHAYLE